MQIVVLEDDQLQSFLKGNPVVLKPNQRVIHPEQGTNSAIRQPLIDNDQNRDSYNQPFVVNPLPVGNSSSGGNPPTGVNPPSGMYPPPGGNPQYGVYPPPGEHPSSGMYPPPGPGGYPPSGMYPPSGPGGNPSSGMYRPPGPGGNLVYQSNPSLVYPPPPPGPSVVDLYQAFFITLPTVMSTYIFFLLGCIIIQYVVCGALTAGQLWISCLVFVIVGSILIKLTRQYNQVYLLFASMFFFLLQQILEIAAFAIAVSHPPILIIHYDYGSSYYGSSYSYDYTQDPGSCKVYSDQAGLPSDYLKYNNGLQYGCLAVHCIQFILSFFVCYQFGRKSWNWQRNLREINHAQQVQVA